MRKNNLCPNRCCNRFWKSACFQTDVSFVLMLWIKSYLIYIYNWMSLTFLIVCIIYYFAHTIKMVRKCQISTMVKHGCMQINLVNLTQSYQIMMIIPRVGQFSIWLKFDNFQMSSVIFPPSLFSVRWLTKDKGLSQSECSVCFCMHYIHVNRSIKMTWA